MIDNALLQALAAQPVFQSALNDLPKFERIKRFPPFSGYRHALKIVLRNEEAVCKAAQMKKVQF